MRKDYTKSGFLSFAITIWALICAVFVGFFPNFSWMMLIAILIPIVGALLFSGYYNKSGLSLCRILVGALFIFSSFTKGVDPLGTKYKMLDYFIAYNIEWLNDFALTLSVFMIMAEFIVGFCLMFNLLPRLATLGATLLMLFFTTTTFFDALYNLVPECGCFGTAIKMSNWQTFFKNLIILAVLIPLIFNNKSLVNKRVTILGQTLFTFLFIGLFVWFEIYNLRHLPVVDFMDWKVGRDMKPAENPEPAEIYLTFKNIETGETEEYLSPNYPWNDSVWMSRWEFVAQRQEGGTQSLGFSILNEEGDDYTHLLFETEKLFVFVAPYLNELTENDFDECYRIYDFANEHGYSYLWITSVSPDYVYELQDKYDMFDEVYYGDELELKSMVRSNPGLILMDNGVIIDKWSKIDFPTEIDLINN
ncbi:MAG: DoxX family membrane protein [Bacteroidales bacterium]|nr:DoxX family membrane protein [Bacteroidales bacterium]